VRALLGNIEPASQASDHLHALRALERQATAPAASALRLATAPEEVLATAARMAARAVVLDLHDRLLGLRDHLAALAGQHLQTLVVITANGQSVQPTSLAHYLLAVIGPLSRATQRLQEAFARVNQSPMGAVAGVASALPVARERAAELLGFDGLVENTLDAVAATDWIEESAGVIAAIGSTLAGLLTDLRLWARDDIGLVVPDDAFVHRGVGQPQRVDPAVLDHLHARVADLTALSAGFVPLLAQRSMLGGEASRLAAVRKFVDAANLAEDVLELCGSVVARAEVNRAMFANRTNRGFATSSELAELLAIDLKLPVDQAYRIAERVVVEALQSALDATTLRTELIDRIALQTIGRELGIEPELLSRCLSPKRFIERRDVLGGPAPVAVSDSLDREAISSRQARAWESDARGRIAAARARLHAAVEALAGQEPA
jgi:argininosuccinate lyase